MTMAARGIVEQQHDTESVEVTRGPAQEGGPSALSSNEGARQHAVQVACGHGSGGVKVTCNP
ncbi:unnamed protein product [Ectocarpus sp. CCAP 1310/34]|nr:unnamed protein product [Ectocarpus sp. CCAP 1310/34]